MLDLFETPHLIPVNVKRVLDQVGDKDEQAIREAVLKIKFNVP